MPHLLSHVIVLVVRLFTRFTTLLSDFVRCLVFFRNSGRLGTFPCVLANLGQPTYGSRVQWQTQLAFVHVTIKVLIITWIQILPDGCGINPVAVFTLAKRDLILAGIIYAFECGSLCGKNGNT